MLWAQHWEQKTKYLDTARLTVRGRRLKLLLAAGLLTVCVGLFASTQGGFTWGKPALSDRIIAVKATLENIKTLESDLNAVKTDLIATEKETAEILAAHDDAKVLTDLTTQERRAIRAALTQKRWQERLVDLGGGLLLGVGSSLIASWITQRLKMRKLQA